MFDKTTLERYLISSLTTFLTAFFGTLALQISAGAGIHLTVAFLLSILTIAGRAGMKAIIESITGPADQAKISQ